MIWLCNFLSPEDGYLRVARKVLLSVVLWKGGRLGGLAPLVKVRRVLRGRAPN